jgi:SWI/SNF-related matrix-associated actin-dependent regulator of chromatin subfamily B protein 1
MVEDYALAPSYHSVIVKTIQDQLSDFKAHSANYDGESGELLSPSPSMDYNNNIQDPIRGLLDDESIAWWMTWRKRNEIAADAALRDSSSSRRRAGRNNSKQQRKKRRIVVDPDEDGNTHMFGDNEQEDDNGTEKEEKNEKKAKAILGDPVEFMDEDFKPMALNEIKINEQAMHEDIRILIKVCAPLTSFFFPFRY